MQRSASHRLRNLPRRTDVDAHPDTVARIVRHFSHVLLAVVAVEYPVPVDPLFTVLTVARFAALKPFYDNGSVGMTADGLITVRDLNAVPLRDRKTVSTLVADENRDRNALYKEIARANGHPEWEADIRSTFAKRWVANAPAGWWYQDGGWKKK